MFCNRTRKSKERIWFRGHADAYHRIIWLFVDLGLPVVNLILLGHGQVAHDSAFGIKELDFGPRFDKTVCDLQLRFELPR